MNKIIQTSVLFFFVAVVTNSYFFFKNSKSNIINNYIDKSKLIVFGDIGYYNHNLKKLIDTSKSFINQNDKIILMGDNFYDNGVESLHDNQWKTFSKFFSDVNKRNIYTIMGNHDYHTNPKSQINNHYWNTPSFYYKLKFNNLDLFFIDTVQLYREHCRISTQIIENIHNKDIFILQNTQLNWLDYELSKSKNRKLVFGHYPIISNGFYKFKLQPIYDLLFPILKQHNVDAYISGHEHNVQYLKKNIEYYKLNQLIIGSSAENREDEYKYIFHNDMFDNKDNYMMIIYEENNKIFVEYINNKYQIKYKYII